MSPTVIQIFSDYTCPFCWLGEVALRKAAAKTGAQLVWRAYPLRAAGPPRLDPQGEVLNQSWQQTISPMAEALDVAMRQPTRVPLTRYAHEAAAWARAQGRFADFHEALFRAYFIDDADLGAVETLLQLARRAGLEAEELAQALRERHFAEEVDEDLLIGQTYGVTGVPTLILGGHLLFGVQEEAALVRAIDAVREGKPVLGLKKLPVVPVQITRK